MPEHDPTSPLDQLAAWCEGNPTRRGLVSFDYLGNDTWRARAKHGTANYQASAASIQEAAAALRVQVSQ